MPEMLNLLYIVPNALSSSECDEIVGEFSKREEENDYSYESSIHAQTGRRTNSTFKAVSLTPGTKAFDIIHKSTGDMVARWIHHLDSFGMFNIHAYKKCLRYSHDYRVLKYEENAQIHPHTDWDVFTFGSCTFALNDGYTGGEFSFFNGKHTVKLEKGAGMIWPADCFWVHEVLPVKAGIRYSANSFITSIPEELKLNAVKSLNELPRDVWKTPYLYRFEG